MLIPLAMLACTSPSPVVGEGATDGGSWWLSQEQTDFDQGEAEVALLVQTAGEGEPAPGLDVIARAAMDGMEHDAAVVQLADEGEGRYASELSFNMSGLWMITGYVSDGARAESYALLVEVSP